MSKRYDISVKHAAQRLGLSEDMVYELAAAGEIAHLRIRGRITTRIVDGRAVEQKKGGRIRFSQEDLQEWEGANRVPMRKASTATSQRSVESISDWMPARRRFS